MSVTLTAIQLAAAMRIGDGVAALEEPQASVLNRILASANRSCRKLRSQCA